jgi:RNA polymerase sigma-70 factor (ECF subfamily)
VSFASLAEAHLDDVYSYLVYVTGDRSAAEDLAAETFERALRRFARYDARRAAPKTWLCQIARSAALDYLRSEARRRRREKVYATRDTATSGESAFGEGLSPALENAVAGLSAGEREVLALRVVLELDGETTARILGISASACSTRLNRALQKLQEKVKNDDR